MKKKIDKNKIIISVLSVALIGTSTVAGIKVNKVKNDSKGAQSNMTVSEEVKEQKSTTQESTTQKSETNKSTTQKQATKSKTTSNIKSKTKEVKSETSTSTTKPSKRTVQINKTIKDNSGHEVTFINAEIENEMVTLCAKIHSHTKDYKGPAGNHFNFDLEKVNYIANTGEKLGFPEGRACKTAMNCHASSEIEPDKHKFDAQSYMMLNYNPSITSITASYTFADGTKGSVVISLK